MKNDSSNRPDWQTVHVRVNDAATGKPVPVRIRFQSSQGVHPPFGRTASFSTERGQDVGGHLKIGSHAYAYINGTCEARLPTGEITIEVSKGLEYAPLSTTVQLRPGQLAIRLTIERWVNLRESGWASGDSHCLFLSPHAALLEGSAEDLAVVNLLATEEPTDPPAIPNILAFSGQEPLLEGGGHMVVVNTQNRHPVLGTLSLLCSHRAVFPLRFGDPNGIDHWSLADWCEQCHRKQGLVVWTDPGQSRLRSEALANLVLGQVDAFEVVSFPEPEPEVLGEWYQLLNAGLRIPLIGGSGKESNAIALGATRTYAFLGDQALTYRSWIEAVRNGHSFITNGPLLSLTIQGQLPGSLIQVQEGESISLSSELKSIPPVDCLDILINGEVIETKEVSGNRQAAVLELDWPTEQSGWIAARCWSEERLENDQCIYAHTSPIYVEVEDQPYQPDLQAVEGVVEHLTAMLQWAEKEGRYETSRQRDHLTSVFTGALEKLKQ